MIPIPAGSRFITAVYLDPSVNPVLHLLQQRPRTPLLRWLGRQSIQLSTFGDLRCVQVQPKFITSGLALSSPLLPLLCLLFIQPTV
jgi:hypothetical protein